MRVVAIVNRGAGSVLEGRVHEEELGGLFRAAGVDARVLFLPGERILDAAREAVASGADAVVAGGGDGTIRTVASVLVGLALLGLVRDVKRTQSFDRWCLPEFTIDVRKRTLPVYLDGEVTLLSPPLRYRVRPRSLPVILPA